MLCPSLSPNPTLPFALHLLPPFNLAASPWLCPSRNCHGKPPTQACCALLTHTAPPAAHKAPTGCADDCKEVVTASMDKSLAMWRMRSAGQGSCAAQAEEVVRLNPAGAPIFSLAAERAALGRFSGLICTSAYAPCGAVPFTSRPCVYDPVCAHLGQSQKGSRRAGLACRAVRGLLVMCCDTVMHTAAGTISPYTGCCGQCWWSWHVLNGQVMQCRPALCVRKGGCAGQSHRSFQVFCGNAAKAITAWEPPDNTIQDNVRFGSICVYV